MEIVRARAADAPVLTTIAFAAKRHWGYPESWIRAWTGTLTLTEAYLDRHPAFLAQFPGCGGISGVAGFYALQLARETAVLDHLWIAPACQRRGIGRALFAHAEERARAAGAQSLAIVGDPHAQPFYERMGARLTGVEPAPMPGAPERVLPVFAKTL